MLYHGDRITFAGYDQDTASPVFSSPNVTQNIMPQPGPVAQFTRPEFPGKFLRPSGDGGQVRLRRIDQVVLDSLAVLRMGEIFFHVTKTIKS